jgi:hypothetical protein
MVSDVSRTSQHHALGAMDAEPPASYIALLQSTTARTLLLHLGRSPIPKHHSSALCMLTCVFGYLTCH